MGRNLHSALKADLRALTYRRSPLSSMRALWRGSRRNRGVDAAGPAVPTPRRRGAAGRALYAGAVEQARAPALYADLGAPDTVEGRFETLQPARGPAARPAARRRARRRPRSRQALFDTYRAASSTTPCAKWASATCRWARRCASWARPSRPRQVLRRRRSRPCRTRRRCEALIGRTVYAEADATAAPRAGRLCRWRSAPRWPAQPLEALLDGERRLAGAAP